MFVRLMTAMTVAMSNAAAAAPASSISRTAPVSALPDNLETRPMQLSKLVLKLSRGVYIGKAKLGLLCIGRYPLTWRGKRSDLSIDEFDDSFRDELKALGYDVISNTSDLFDTRETSRAEYLVGGTITMMSVDACFPNSGLGDGVSAKGTAVMEVQWQLYDRIDRTVVMRLTTRQEYRKKQVDPSGISGLVLAAFGENVRALAASGDLQKYLVGERRDPETLRTAKNGLAPIIMALPVKNAGSISTAVGSTVLIQSASGHGSGFLISQDGYFLSNHHVVGTSKYVKIRWADGLEELGEVVRSDHGRDVALIKGAARDRAPLRLRATSPEIGADVYAIGAPIDEKLQNTVTKGILSARRIEDGYSFLQSDVSINPGNSGGPLVDAKGEVAGIADLGLFAGSAPLGINFFIPAHEALEFLAIKPK